MSCLPGYARRSRPTVMTWHRHLNHAEFEVFVWRDHAGRVRFNGQWPTAGRFRERVWPVFWRVRRRWRTTDAWEARASSPWAIAFDRSQDKAFRVERTRRWLVDRPLQRQWDRIDEILIATRGTRA